MDMQQNAQGQMPVQEPAKTERSIGAIIGSVIVVLILLIGAIYLLKDRPAAEPIPSPSTGEIRTEPDPATEMLMNQGGSDELEAIQNDLNTTDLRGLDQELQTIEGQMGM